MKFRHFLLASAVVILSGCTAPVPTTPTNTTSTTQTPTKSTTAAKTTTSTTSQPTTFTMADVSQHNNSSDCWLVIDNSVYDVTNFISQHPGGDEILKGCGKDATAMFAGEGKHSGPQAQSILPTLKLGEIAN